ncbi:MAG: phage Gp37/Gp68 family protein [Euryarchaeota archaeon]|nr:phage Gp37/Gp68 family protein [Euryarchaeota archaeon]MDE1836652.1 phage Gp37/Gp68 family protein [Euryarchaeota archaeon]MDE1880319.1 phage Gp37/Gp68 family protein [Euryarchaeota archaeon]MDE2044622.1 phage Gp37/Gp68 family protein [Thermoplasmata archaeon]
MFKGRSWNPVTGCSRVSEGCGKGPEGLEEGGACYAEMLHYRFNTEWYGEPYREWTEENAKFNVRLHPERLLLPEKWKESSGVFINSMSDLFHHLVPFEFIDSVLTVIRRTPQHVYLVLTKRPAIMLRYVRKYTEVHDELPENLWLGTSVETQRWAEARIPPLLSTGAQVMFLSCEPLLGALDLTKYLPNLHWVITGGQSGRGAQPMDLNWVRSLRDQCTTAKVPFFLKQLGGPTDKRGGDAALLDGRLWREFPRG